MGTWVEWHRAYEEPGSSLSRRLGVVKQRLRMAIEGVGPEATILSLCSGDGRDVIGVLSDGSVTVRRAVLVESDPDLAGRARQSAADVGIAEVEVRVGDAGAVASFADQLPVDVLMLCGIFGNIDHGRVRNVIGCTPSLVKLGGYVVWTRGGSDPDRRPEIRDWFVEAGMEEITFDGAPELYGVGLNRWTGAARLAQGLPSRLFRFL